LKDIITGLEVVIGFLGSSVSIENSIALFDPIYELIDFGVLLTASE